MDCKTPGLPLLHYLLIGSNSCQLNRWCHPTISYYVLSVFSCPRSFPASGSFPLSQLFASGGQSIRASASASVLPMNIQGYFPFSSVQSLSSVRLFVTPWTAARQTSLSITNSWSLLKLMSVDLVMPSKSHPLSSPSAAFYLSQHQGLFKWVSSLHQVAKVLEFQLQHQSFQWRPRTDLLEDGLVDLLAVQGALKSLCQHHSSKASILWCSAFFKAQSHIHAWLLEKP